MQETPSQIAFGLGVRIASVLVAVLLAWGAGPGGSRAQPDSVRTQILKEKGFPPNHSPRGALWRTAAVPGWGQYYNRQYYKIPFIYAGLAALGYRIYQSNQRYLLFDRAHLYKLGQGMEGQNPHSQYKSQFNEVKDLVAQARQLRTQRDKFRRKRDISILGAGLFYALTLLDAYVSAHLLTFDVDDDLAVRVHPTGTPGAVPARHAGAGVPPRQPAPRARQGLGMRVQVRF